MLRKDRGSNFGVVPEGEDPEVWEPIAGYNGRYEVSSWGRVRSIARTTTRVHHGTVVTQPIAERFLRIAYTVEDGYAVVNLSRCGKTKSHGVHALVAEAFIGKRPLGFHVCHNDGIPAHNWKTNLRYDTPTGNSADRKRHGTDAVGVNNPSAKLTVEAVLRIVVLLRDISPKEISNILNVPRTTVSSIKHGRTWSHITGIGSK